MLKDNQSPNLEYAVLFGATTYDPKNRIKDFTNYIPTFTDEPSTNIDVAIATDDYFAKFKAKELHMEIGELRLWQLQTMIIM